MLGCCGSMHMYMCVCLVALLCIPRPLPTHAANPAPWTPHPQTPQQARTFQTAAAAAKTASAAATPALLSALALPGVKTALAGCGASELAALPAQQLLDRIDAEVAVIETVHGWPNLGFENEFGSDSDFLYNLWQIPLLAPAASSMSMGAGEGHDCYPLTDILRVNASVCAEFGWETSKAGSFPQVPTCKWQTSSSMCINTVPAGLEAVETGLYGFPKFKVRGAPQNFQEASNRLVYAAVNLQRLDTGSSGVFGGIGMVFRPSYIRNMTQLAPTDTGLYAGCLLQADPDLIEPSGFSICSEEQNATACNYRINCDWIDSSSDGGGEAESNDTNGTCVDVYCPHWKTKEACTKYSGIGCSWHILKHACAQINTAADSAGLPTLTTEELHTITSGTLAGKRLGQQAAPFPTPPTLGCGGWGGPPFPVGTLDDFHHLFLPNAQAWAHENTTSAPKSQEELGNRLCRLFNPSATEVSGIGTLRYWEAAVGGTPLYPDAVKFVIGDFGSLFGTPLGQTLRDWCVSRGWLLVWALGAAGQNVQAEWFGEPPIYSLFNQRTLDPIVAAAVPVGNVSNLTTMAVQSQFGQLWGFIEKYRETHPAAPPPAGDPIPPPPFNVSVITYWYANQPKGLLLEQLTGVHACGAEATDRCVGTLVTSGRCVCYEPSGNASHT